MIDKLRKLQENSYSPYSNYKVAAIAVMKDNKEFCGVNVENAAYGSSICAERSACLSAISNGYKKGDFKELYVMVDGGDLGTPCMACRQVISELFDNDITIHCCSTNGEMVDYKVSELCPYPFTGDDLI